MTSILPLCSLQNPDHPLVDGAPRACGKCGDSLCLRQQVINLALGLTDEMSCLPCLAKENSQAPAEVLDGIRDYILSRDCFAKEWKRYISVEYCPNQSGCVPSTCFQK